MAAAGLRAGTGSGVQADSSTPSLEERWQACRVEPREQPAPSRVELDAARGRTIPDVLASNLDVVFVGINPGLWSGAIGHHFARPGNRFWKALHVSGFTDRIVSPFEDARLLRCGIGLTNLVARATAAAAELTEEELRAAPSLLDRKLTPLRPRIVAVLGIGAYRAAFARPKAPLGRQDRWIGVAPVWVLPNPSGLNAHHQLDDLAARFAEVRAALA